jgi:hypothetical protein
MNTANIIKLAACLAWAGVAVSSATPASAYAVTLQIGDYAACSANIETGSTNFCGQTWPYKQTIKFLGDPCNGGGCTEGSGVTYTDFVYEPGRKTAVLEQMCQLSRRYYGLDSCAC